MNTNHDPKLRTSDSLRNPASDQDDSPSASSSSTQESSRANSELSPTTIANNTNAGKLSDLFMLRMDGRLLGGLAVLCVAGIAGWLFFANIFKNPSEEVAEEKKSYTLITIHGDDVGSDADFSEKRAADPYPPLLAQELTFVSRTQADTMIDDIDLVLGIEIGGVAKAYPITQLVGPHREIINDKLGGQFIAATW